MPSDKQTPTGTAVLDASRPTADMKIAHEVGGVIAHMLGDGRSTIDPEVVIWTGAVAEDLRGRVEDNLISGTDASQWEKLDRQLDGASRPVVLLAAELVLLREQPVRTALPKTRREHVERVLGHLKVPTEIPHELSICLQRASGVAGFKPGMSYNGWLWKHIIWASTFVRHFAELPESDREAARRDPRELQRQMLASGADQSDIRNALQFLAAPEYFEPISSMQMKRKIRDGLSNAIGGSSGEGVDDVDRDLFAIRGALAQEVTAPFNFWSPGIVERWQPAKERSAGEDEDEQVPEPREPHYWLYSPGAQASAWPEFSASGVMGIGWDDLGDLASYPSQEAIRQALDTDGTGASMRNDVRALWQFQHEMAVGDIVYAKRGRREIIGRGVVMSEPRHERER
ncbi:MAG: hypothetical protein Q4G51_05845 [Dermatophilus congolensis]|nr:hypothetical protein [Dermatophilus congolensis]